MLSDVAVDVVNQQLPIVVVVETLFVDPDGRQDHCCRNVAVALYFLDVVILQHAAVKYHAVPSEDVAVAVLDGYVVAGDAAAVVVGAVHTLQVDYRSTVIIMMTFHHYHHHHHHRQCHDVVADVE